MFGAQEMQTKDFLESLTKSNVRCSTGYTVSIKLTESGYTDVKWIKCPHNKIWHQISVMTLMDLQS
jgi:hypothetical protein